jgi:hypothetical protein
MNRGLMDIERAQEFGSTALEKSQVGRVVN